MQLKLKRSQREAGLVSSSVVFCLDARVAFTREERQNLQRYKLHGQVIYNSEASRKLLDKSAGQQDGSFAGSVKSLATIALAAMRLNISVTSLEKGQHIECKSMDELIGAEDAIMTACQNLKAYLDTAATFDNTEILVDYETGRPQLVAQSVSPDPQLIAPAPAPAAIERRATAPELPEYSTSSEESDIEWEPQSSYASSSYAGIAGPGGIDKDSFIYIGGAVLVLIFLVSSCT